MLGSGSRDQQNEVTETKWCWPLDLRYFYPRVMRLGSSQPDVWELLWLIVSSGSMIFIDVLTNYPNTGTVRQDEISGGSGSRLQPGLEHVSDI